MLNRLLLVPLAGLSGAFLVFLLVSSWTAADGSGPRMALSVSGAGVSCDGAEQPTCSVPDGGAFSLAVEVIEAPPAGYVGFQTELHYGGLIYLPASLVSEVVWPESALALRSPNQPDGREGLVGHGDLSALSPPLPVSVHTGPVVELDFICPENAQIHTLALLPYDLETRLLGSGFKAADAKGGVAETVPAKTAGQRELDLDGDASPETTNVAAAIELTCGEPPPTATATFTTTPSATPPQLVGDTSCDGVVNSIDALLLLQFDAGLLGSLPCGQNADANADGEVNAIDATLILQFDAGLIDTLPP